MKIKLTQIVLFIVAPAIITACAGVSLVSKPGDKSWSSIISSPANTPATKIYYKDGRLVNVAKCEGSSWLGCMSDAGKICNDLGYDVLEKNTAKQSALFFGDKDLKELYYICKEPPPDLPSK